MATDDGGSTEVQRALGYGPEPDQVGDLWLPRVPARGSRRPVVVLLHGGFWRERYRRDLMDPLAADLARGGLAVWNLEYRRVRGAGGWPGTFEDVAAGIDHLRTLARTPGARLDPSVVTVVGHSAGGHLALWAAGRHRLPATAPGVRPLVRPRRVVALAPVADLRAADGAGLSDGAVRELLGGGPDEQPRRWDLADPVVRVGHGVPVVLLHGRHDEDVPVAQSERYRDVARRAGDPVELRTGPWDHLSLIDPTTAAWQVASPFVVDPPRTLTPAPGRAAHPGSR
jgi:acetyl esterase/lipase